MLVYVPVCVPIEVIVLVVNPFWSILFNVGLNRPTPHFSTIFRSIAGQVNTYVHVCMYVYVF